MAPLNPRSPKSRMSETRLSPAAENYLLSILQLEEQGVRVTSTQLAEQLKRLPVGEGLGTSLPSVSGMLGRLFREGLVESTANNKDIVLTPSGRKAAESMVRRHRLAERMVVDLLGLEMHKAHVEAHRLEHAISPELAHKIVNRLGNPGTCPFGHPIPGSGYIPPKDSFRLSAVKQGQNLVIDRVPEDDQTLLEYFVTNGLIPGQKFTVTEAAPYRGVIRLSSGSASEVVVGYVVAERIWVCLNKAK
ncbi:MAG: metal-dependent transcriptional regulator [SAR202 cluster bacterium]|nr:metal-dependent transcriptional regulator [SAR202 cluster bacterium]